MRLCGILLFICLFQHSYYCHFIADEDKSTRILVIGDSVDRFANLYWCKINNGEFCQPRKHEHDRGEHDKINLTFCNSILPNNHNYKEFFSSHSRHSVWDIQICFLPQKSLILSFIFNNFGIRNQLQCNKDAKSDLVNTGMEGFKYDVKYNTSTFIYKSLLPAIIAVETFIQGKNDGVLLQSALWDIRNSWECDDITNILHDDKLRQQWINNWKLNMESFILHMKSTIFNDSLWFGMRSPNPLIYSKNEKPWINKDMNILISMLMNSIESITKKLNIDFIDFYSFPNVENRIDAVHPSKEASILLYGEDIDAIEHFFWNKIEGIVLELGALQGDSYTGSQSKLFEIFGWKRILIEANPIHIEGLQILEISEIKHVNFFILDVEGAELSVLESINWSVYSFDIIVIEKNHVKDIIQFFKLSQYDLIADIGRNLWFKNVNYIASRRSDLDNSVECYRGCMKGGVCKSKNSKCRKLLTL
eukprot:gene8622-17789_t